MSEKTTTVHPKDRRIAAHAGWAAEAFKDHKIELRLNQGLYRHWRCAKPGDGNHSFSITTIPGSILVTGDIGTLVVERETEMIHWCKTAIRDVHYFASKVPQEFKKYEYDPDMARRYIAEELQSDELSEEDRETLLDLQEDCDDGELDFKRCLHESGYIDGCDFPDLDNYTSSFLWCREAIKWFLAHYETEARIP